ncbi:CLUMA_CG019602, isoform A [Clunio marinus]|uniref:CLUMA_CG019602, isoform A n=1 Tax=Clunio marinus TaxID=568069 RepID=A0A1J1J4F8_9DIPT|nr:CLUMA_CG019602, isoform A [Clunio marinus]
MKNHFRIYLAAIVCLILLTNVSTKKSEPESEDSTEGNVDEHSCDSGSGTCVDKCDESLTIGTDPDCESGKVCCARKCLLSGIQGINGICRPQSECNALFPDKLFWKDDCRKEEKCCFQLPPREPPTP